jgi:hypothetical protein
LAISTIAYKVTRYQYMFMYIILIKIQYKLTWRQYHPVLFS